MKTDKCPQLNDKEITSRTSRDLADEAAKSYAWKSQGNTPPFADLAGAYTPSPKPASYVGTPALTIEGEREGFRRHLGGQGRAASTIECYGQHLGAFRRFVEARGVCDLRAVTASEVSAYEAHLGSSGRKTQTQRTMLRALKRFFEYLVDVGKLFVSPAEHLRDPKEPRAEAAPLPDAEMARLMAAPELRHPAGVRDRAILELLRVTGLRAGELCALAVFDLDLDGGQVRVRSQGGTSDRVVPIDSEAGRWVKRYLVETRPRHAKRAASGERRLFLQITGKPLTPAALGMVMRSCRWKTGIGVSCLVMRRAARAALVRDGVDEHGARRILGIGGRGAA